MNDEDLSPPILVSVRQAEKAIGIGHTKIYELINQGKIKTVTIGRRRLVVVSSLEELANGTS